jgi:hypothetical protein
MRKAFWFESLTGGDHSEDLGVDGDNIKMDLRERVLESVNWTYLTQDKDRWRALVNTVINLWVP